MHKVNFKLLVMICILAFTSISTAQITRSGTKNPPSNYLISVGNWRIGWGVHLYPDATQEYDPLKQLFVVGTPLTTPIPFCGVPFRYEIIIPGKSIVWNIPNDTSFIGAVNFQTCLLFN